MNILCDDTRKYGLSYIQGRLTFGSIRYEVWEPMVKYMNHQLKLVLSKEDLRPAKLLLLD